MSLHLVAIPNDLDGYTATAAIFDTNATQYFLLYVILTHVEKPVRMVGQHEPPSFPTNEAVIDMAILTARMALAPIIRTTEKNVEAEGHGYKIMRE